jgi:hypothetical protein
MTTYTDTVASIDWEAADRVAERLGARTRELVAEREPESACLWTLRMAAETARFGTVANGPRAASYLELAVLLGHVAPDPFDDERRENEDEDGDAGQDDQDGDPGEGGSPWR